MTDPAPPLSLQDVINAVNAAGSAQGTTIGLPKGVKPVGVDQHPQTGGGHPGMSFVPGAVSQFGTPLNAHPYQEGEQLKPGAGTQAEIATMQGKLVQAGLLTPQEVRPGFWDAKSADAYKVVLAYANQHGMNVQDSLNTFLANPLQPAAAYRAPIAITNPVQSQSDFATVAQQMTGGGLPASESQAFSGYQTGQEEAARARYVSGKTDQSSSYVGAASPTAGARQYILGHNQQDIVNYDMALRTQQFAAALKEL